MGCAATPPCVYAVFWAVGVIAPSSRSRADRIVLPHLASDSLPTKDRERQIALHLVSLGAGATYRCGVVVGVLPTEPGRCGEHDLRRALQAARLIAEAATSALAQLEDFVNDMLITKLPADQEPHPRIKAGDAARSLAESSTKQAFANAKVEIERLAAQLDKGQALDLRWTIIGLFISAVGTSLSYWA